ncbi:MAG: sigma-54-dependent transcriptional regulator [Gammaproteobacteria bacterium]
MSHILIVEDEAVIRASLRKLLERNGYSVAEAGSVQEARDRFEFGDFDLVISDLRLPGEQGTTLIALAAPVPVLIMTSYASLKSAVDAMKQGAVDYIAKPFDHDEMLLSVRRILKESALERQAAFLKKDIERSFPTTNIIGSCPAMQELFRRIARVAPTDSTVLILGESGTGKELVARALHEQSPRRDGPLISVNCAAIPETLIESELFGHEKGAFTGAVAMRKGLVEAADGGTLFLDEIGELPLEAQARLLRLLQEKEVRRVGAVESRKVDLRVCAATHRDLRALVASGRFREDLFYRLNVFDLKLPPLRERGDDVIELAEKLLERACRKIKRESLSCGPEALRAIGGHSWPGNVRELENAIERAVILCDGNTVLPEHLGIEPAPEDRGEGGVPDPGDDLSLEDYFARFVLEHQDAMSETELAQKLGISRKSLWERRQRLGIPRKKG